MKFTNIAKGVCLLFLIVLTSCTSLEKMKFKKELQNSLSSLIIADKTTEKEIKDRFGKPYFIASRKESPYVYVYHKGTYFTKNSEENKKILLALLPPEIAYNKRELRKTFLEIYFHRDRRTVSGYKLAQYLEREKRKPEPEKSEEELLWEQQLRERYRDKDPPKILNRIIFEELVQ